MVISHWIFLQAFSACGWIAAICRSSSNISLTLWDHDRTVTAILRRWMRSNEASLELWTIIPAWWGLVPRVTLEGKLELHTEIKRKMKVDTNTKPRATRVADKSNQSCPLHHHSPPIRLHQSISSLMSDWILSASKVQGEGGVLLNFPND